MIIDRALLRPNDPMVTFCGLCGRPMRICRYSCLAQQLHAEAGLLYSDLCILRSERAYNRRLSLLCERARYRWHRRLIAWNRAVS